MPVLTLFDHDYTGSSTAREIDSSVFLPDIGGHNPTSVHFMATPETSLQNPRISACFKGTVAKSCQGLSRRHRSTGTAGRPAERTEAAPVTGSRLRAFAAVTN
jgi:hypothetical protein